MTRQGALHFNANGAAGCSGLLRPMALALLTATLVGCATGPAPSERGRAQSRPVASPDQDGPPANPPPDLALTPDPEPKIEPIRSGGPNKPYVVLGQSYEPAAADIAWKERGYASWYGTKFHGRKTASGELFSMYGITAAHRTLPLPSYARVRNLQNGKEIIVRVNDRGPFHSSRVMDLSYAAAVKLGISTLGRAQVEIERITFEDIRTGAWRKLPDADVREAQVAAPQTDPIADLAAQMAEHVSAQVAPHVASQEVARAPVPPVDSGPIPASDGATGVGVSNASVVPVVSAVREEDPERAYTAAAQGYWVQLAALARRDGVDRLQQRILADVSDLAPMLAVFREDAVYKLQIGPYESRQQAHLTARRLRDAVQLAPLVIERR